MARNVAGRAAVMGRLTPGNSTPLRIGTIGSVLDISDDLRILSSRRNLAERLAASVGTPWGQGLKKTVIAVATDIRLDGRSSVVLEIGT